jgi:dolichol kinase
MDGTQEDVIELTHGLYRFIEAAEDAFSRRRRQAAEARGRLRERALLLQERYRAAAHSASERASARMTAIADGLHELQEALAERRARRADLRERWQRLTRHYEAWVAHLRESRAEVQGTAALPHVKPRNLWRNLFHVGMGLGCVAGYELLFSQATMIAIGLSAFGLFAFMDILRRVSPRWNERFVQRAFGKISRPGEAHRIPSATWYVVSLTLGAWLLPQHAIAVGALVLAFGDPVAALMGKRFGRIKLVGDKSLVGSLSFAVVTMIVVSLFAWVAMPGWGPIRGFGLGAAVGLVGAVTELISTRLDDNLTIPLATGVVAMLLL